MEIAVAIANHNQHAQVRKCLKALMRQTFKPSAIYVMSDADPWKPNKSDPDCLVAIDNPPEKGGRCSNRNSVIPRFLSDRFDAIVFIDGDCVPENREFLEMYTRLLGSHDLVFGTRRHTDPAGLELPPSDLLTANMDNLYARQPLDFRDLRVVAGAVGAWGTAKTFEERVDLMITGMVGWSCNFAMTESGVRKLVNFMRSTYQCDDGIFDSSTFKDGWGYEDVAMGIDAMFAGLDVWISDDVRVVHKAHNRSDGLFDHVKGRHLMMERYRKLLKQSNIRNKVYMTAIVAILFFFSGLITGMVTIAISLAE